MCLKKSEVSIAEGDEESSDDEDDDDDDDDEYDDDETQRDETESVTVVGDDEDDKEIDVLDTIEEEKVRSITRVVQSTDAEVHRVHRAGPTACPGDGVHGRR